MFYSISTGVFVLWRQRQACILTQAEYVYFDLFGGLEPTDHSSGYAVLDCPGPGWDLLSGMNAAGMFFRRCPELQISAIACRIIFYIFCIL